MPRHMLTLQVTSWNACEPTNQKGELYGSLIHESITFSDNKSINLMLKLIRFHLKYQK